MRKTTALILLLLLLAAAASPVLAAVAPAPEEYRLRPGDVLAINVLGYEEFTPPPNTSGPTGYLVRPDGNFSFPLIGKVAVADLTVDALAETLRSRLAEYLLEPRVTVNLVRLGGTRIHVLGEVAKPGAYELEKAHNLLDAITAAGGPTASGAKRHVYVVRRSRPGEFQKVNLLAILKKGDQSQNVVLNEGDSVFLTSNGRINFGADILPFITATFLVRDLTRP